MNIAKNFKNIFFYRALSAAASDALRGGLVGFEPELNLGLLDGSVS